MTMLDRRVPVRFATAVAGVGRAALVEGEHFIATQDHAPGCTCCSARNPAGRALAALLQDRARGRVAFFDEVAVVTQSSAGRQMVIEALRSDPVASACFRIEQG